MFRRGARRPGGVIRLALVACGAQGCGVDVGVDAKPAAEILLAVAELNARNGLSILVTVEVEGADSVWVAYAPVGGSVQALTPSHPGASGPVEIPVLGLLPETAYDLGVFAAGGGGVAQHPLSPTTTAALPADLPAYSASGPDPSPGYVAFAAGRYGLVIDNGGRVVWYRAFPDGPGLNFQPQANGRYYARPPPPEPGAPARWLEIDPAGNETRSFGCARGLHPRFHDLIVEPDGAYWIMCDETRITDLSHLGGSPEASVTGTVVQHMSAREALLFEWSAFDHFDIADLDPSARSGPTVNWTHGNAMARAVDGNLLVSFRNLSEITKIDVTSGQVLWRMGGARSDFVFEGTPAPGFARQHGVRVAGEDGLILLDNSGDPGASRFERYTFDRVAGTARLVASHGPATPVIAQLGGTTQPLPGGRALVAYGDGGRVQEYDAHGTVVWEIAGSSGYVFRAERVRSLYHPAPLPP